MIGAAALAVGMGAASMAAAQSCSLSGVSQPIAISYDPFNPVAQGNLNATITFTRPSQQGGAKTQAARFYFIQPAGQPNYQILFNSVNVLYSAPFTGAPTLQNNGNITPTAAGTLIQIWGTASDPDTVTVPLTITIPPGADLSAGEPLRFDVRYVCKGTGGLSDVDTPQILGNAITVQISVLSALQASYSGPAMDFGEIGNKTTADITTTPISVTGNVRVASSGPYTVAVASTNNYRLMAGGPTTIDYQATFLGATLNNASPTFTTRTCSRAGVSGVNLPITTRLMEGGQGKAPAPVYSDTINVTVSPLVSGPAPGTAPCP
ncbi:MAG TPA: hypothetical protein VFF48_03990 [Brevundimonas sp.]|nr:hypothetical protein [Brevundimonas sp.]